jgi:Ca-activated chloride channel family protein
MIQYEQTTYFYLLFLIPVLAFGYALFTLWKKRVQQSFASAEMLAHIAPERSFFKGWLKQVILWLGLVFICLGLVNPQIGTELETVKREGVDLVFAIDVSKSMLAEDIAPNRLEKAKRLASELINQLVSDRVGIIAYASSAIPHLPITTDYAAARMFLSSLDTNMVSSQGTAISAATRLAETYFDDENQTNRVVCIISDGEDHGEDALVAAKQAAAQGIRFFTVVVGTEKGSVIPVKQGNSISYKKDANGEVVITKSDFDQMKSIAEETDGLFLDGSNTDAVVTAIIDRLKEMDKQEFEAKQFVKFKDQFQWFLGIGLFLIVLDGFLFLRKTQWVKRLNLFHDA